MCLTVSHGSGQYRKWIFEASDNKQDISVDKLLLIFASLSIGFFNNLFSDVIIVSNDFINVSAFSIRSFSGFTVLSMFLVSSPTSFAFVSHKSMLTVDWRPKSLRNGSHSSALHFIGGRFSFWKIEWKEFALSQKFDTNSLVLLSSSCLKINGVFFSSSMTGVQSFAANSNSDREEYLFLMYWRWISNSDSERCEMWGMR